MADTRLAVYFRTLLQCQRHVDVAVAVAPNPPTVETALFLSETFLHTQAIFHCTKSHESAPGSEQVVQGHEARWTELWGLAGMDTAHDNIVRIRLTSHECIRCFPGQITLAQLLARA